MNIDTTTRSMSVRDVTAAWTNRTVSCNAEYQRGAAWSQRQQQLLVDSVLRGYPLPLFYFQTVTQADAFGATFSTLDVIDGQQRIRALASYLNGDWALMKITDERVALPASVKALPVSWSGRFFTDLPDDDQQRLLDTALPVVLLADASADEVRDVFIRLQAGTSLSAQQKRDAWPGHVGPFIETLAGKLGRQGRFVTLFAAVDNRSRASSGDDGRDPHLKARETCGQLLTLFLHLHDRGGLVPLNSSSLNRMYHRNAALDVNGPVADRFVRLLEHTESVIASRPSHAPKKLVKTRLFSLVTYLHALMDAPVALNHALGQISRHFWRVDEVVVSAAEPVGRVGSVDLLTTHYTWFQDSKMGGIRLPELDERRLFTDDQKTAIYAATDGVCPICDQPVMRQYAEFDHIVPWILGGRTITDNGRAVHGRCHPRGIAALTAATATDVAAQAA